jgi:hypothetical protein
MRTPIHSGPATASAAISSLAIAAALLAGCAAGSAITPPGSDAPTESPRPATSLVASPAGSATLPVITPVPSPAQAGSAQPAGTPIPAPTETASPAVAATARPTATPRPVATPARPAGTPLATPRPTAAAARGSITGQALAGPTCPVAKLPPDPACADRPVPGVVIVITDAAGSVVQSVTTDGEGRYTIKLPPGTYTLTPQPRQGLMRTAAPATVSLAAGATETVDFAYDTGIR